MMAFIEQEATEKVEEIDAKVIKLCLPVNLVIVFLASCKESCDTHLFPGGGGVQHREGSSGSDPEGQNNGVL